mgnify:CR=1 FL=1
MAILCTAFIGQQELFKANKGGREIDEHVL